MLFDIEAERTAQQRRSQKSKILETVEIPSVSPTADRIFKLACDDNVDLDLFAHAIQEDAGITARLISLANSAYFGPKHPIITVEQAIINVLGLPMVKSLVLAILLGQKFNNKQCPNFSVLQHWCESLVVAQTMNLIARKSATLDANQAYLTGLLHNIGDLLLAHLFSDKMLQVLDSIQDNNFVTLENKLTIQRQTIGLEYLFSGGWLLKRWGLPDEVNHTLLALAESYEQGIEPNSDATILLKFIINFAFDNPKKTPEATEQTLAVLCKQLQIPQNTVLDILNEHSKRLEDAHLVAQHLSSGGSQ